MTKFAFYQLFEFESCTYTYLIYDLNNKEGIIIDPVLETLERDLKLVQELGVKLKWIIETHVHADHITSAGLMREKTGAKIAVSHAAKIACADYPLRDQDTLRFGEFNIKAIETPGHTDSCMSFVFEDRVFTGDCLLIRGCGRTDFQQGNSAKLYESVRSKLFMLPDETLVFPAHDYRGISHSTIGEEKSFNPRLKLGTTLEQFAQIMSELKLAHPKKIHEALPANLACGQAKQTRNLHTSLNNGIPEVTPQEIFTNLEKAKKGHIRLIDVRRPDEFTGELGHIEGARLLTLGPDLQSFLEQGDRSEEIVFICRSGGRSGNATALAHQMGYKFAVNMVGGMLAWNESNFPITKES
jgi:glyoxylase-like metal-dependent hydrolase (beta-lactamase superfamily II)/rhodanese-related sulfurtransferase